MKKKQRFHLKITNKRQLTLLGMIVFYAWDDCKKRLRKDGIWISDGQIDKRRKNISILTQEDMRDEKRLGVIHRRLEDLMEEAFDEARK